MENIGDWLYILILIIAGISSLISSARKKTNSKTTNAPFPEASIDDHEDENPWTSHNKKEAVPNEKKPVYTAESEKQILTIKTNQKRYDRFNTDEGKSSLIGKETRLTTIHETENENLQSLSEDIPSDIDEWRKAFIYSEIFKPKH